MPRKRLPLPSSREIDTSEMPGRIAGMTPAAQPPATEKGSLDIRKVTDAFFIAVYTTKLLLKLYEEPIAY
ncbi:hypothetical protein llap_19731 [Limosa lapponica baueri]|uniref:Uncharacterized protein n=1 Tax=Limosa lapponica baueri TaxID=1758121 RepID=A0A2I0T837_LIMLA|nr:hypothetical protein llap_19731 [Limosa lapponica baueri]